MKLGYALGMAAVTFALGFGTGRLTRSASETLETKVELPVETPSVVVEEPIGDRYRQDFRQDFSSLDRRTTIDARRNDHGYHSILNRVKDKLREIKRNPDDGIIPDLVKDLRLHRFLGREAPPLPEGAEAIQFADLRPSLGSRRYNASYKLLLGEIEAQMEAADPDMIHDLIIDLDLDRYVK